jgi:hypothetical protein
MQLFNRTIHLPFEAAAQAGETEAAKGLSLRWVALAVLVGVPLISSFVYVVVPEIPRPDVAILVGALTFLLTGVFLGFKSPGTTILEGLIAGGILALLTGAILMIPLGMSIPLPMLVFGVIAAPMLTMAGAWVGEMLEGTVDESRETSGIQWGWIGVGILLGFMLSNYSVFLTRAIFGFEAPGIALCYASSFVVAGVFVGFFSPGVTILEPALAGTGVVLLEAISLQFLMGVPFPPLAVLIGLVLAAMLAMVGGAIGEWIQDRRALARE